MDMKQNNYSNLAKAILGVGLAMVAGYIEVNGGNTGLLWIGVFICFVSIT